MSTFFEIAHHVKAGISTILMQDARASNSKSLKVHKKWGLRYVENSTILNFKGRF